MKPERWQQIEKLLKGALEVEAGQRAAFLDETCTGDEKMRREVDSLLAAIEQTGSSIEAPAFDAAGESATKGRSESLVDRRLGHYKIAGEIGHGGMGVVYLAQDTSLGRQVALKLLPGHLTEDEEALRRFKQEARAASALNHPNILTIHEIGQIDGIHFMATEYVEGETLRRHMSNARMKLTEVLDVAIQVASALQSAHQAGIVHRDIKPENIMLRPDGYVKVLDFGIAKLTERKQEAADSRATTHVTAETVPGTVIGTPRYMSPEQAQGIGVDARTDIFSLGITLYEMIAGRAPFEGTNLIDLIVSILAKEPPPLTECSPEAPEALESIVTRALRKDRDERYQTVEQMLADLKNVRRELEIAGEEMPVVRTRKPTTLPITFSGEYLLRAVVRHKRSAIVILATLVVTMAAITYFTPTSRAINSLAVLPFVNDSNDPNMEYLSDGIAESLINTLSQLPNLKVIARSSVFTYKGRAIDPRAVGRDLSVRAVLTGQVSQRGDGLFIGVELADAKDNSHIWGERYNRKLADILVVQEDIAKQVTDSLRITVTGEQQTLVTKSYTENAEAYKLYLKGRYYSNKFTTDGLRKGVDYLNQAIDMDPTYALAYAGLALSYYDASGQYLPSSEAMPRAKAAAMRALKLDDTLAEAHTALAQVKAQYEWDWAEAEKEYRRALQLKPGYASAHQWYAWYLVEQGRLDEAMAALTRARELEPLTPRISTNLAWTHYLTRHYDEAIRQFRNVIDMEPNFIMARYSLGLAYEQKGMFEEAIAEFKKARLLDQEQPAYLGLLGHAYAVSGKGGEARRVLDELRERWKQKQVDPFFMAVIYVGLGEKDQAFAFLEEACQQRSDEVLTLKVDPRLDSLRSDPRFTDLLRRLNLAP